MELLAVAIGQYSIRDGPQGKSRFRFPDGMFRRENIAPIIGHRRTSRVSEEPLESTPEEAGRPNIIVHDAVPSTVPEMAPEAMGEISEELGSALRATATVYASQGVSSRRGSSTLAPMKATDQPQVLSGWLQSPREPTKVAPSWGYGEKGQWPSTQVLDWWEADAWLETVPDVKNLFLTIVFEVLPGLFGGLLCWLLDGWASAVNRNLLWQRFLNGPGVLYQYLLVSSPHWVMVLIWCQLQPDIPAVEVFFPFVLLIWRSSCIGLKYAYLAPSDMQEVRRSPEWTKSGRSARSIGSQRFFDWSGTLSLDTMECLCKSAARLGMLPQVRASVCNVGVENAREMWSFTCSRLGLRCDDNMRRVQPEQGNYPPLLCKYGDVREVFWLDDISTMDELVEAGKLPVIVVAYYFVSKAFRKLSIKRLLFIWICAAFMCFLHPFVLYVMNSPPFGSTPVEKAVYGLRCVAVLVPFMQVMLFVNYPPIEGLKRLELADSILAAYGRGEARMKYLAGRVEYPKLDIRNTEDLKSFWLLTRLLGPTYEVGILTRYNCAFVAVSVGFLCFTTAGLVISARLGIVAWGVYAEFLVLYITGAVSVMTASLLCMRLNDSAYLFEAVARRAGIQHPELGDLAKDVCADISNEHGQLHHFRIMYVPAKPALMSLLWSGMTLLTGIFITAMPNVCVPFFLLSAGCKEHDPVA